MWHPQQLSGDTQRISKLAKGVSIGPGNPFFDEKVAAFEENQSVETATELLAASLVGGDGSAGDIASQFLQKKTSALHFGVRRVVVPESTDTLGSVANQDALDFLCKTSELRNQIHIAREETRQFPRNAFSWSNLARSYLLLGEVDKALSSMRVALKLAPDNRYVLRSAARLLVHVERPIDAAKTLRKSRAIRHDPWVMAAEISASEIAGIGSKSAQRAKKLLADQSDPSFFTELAGSFATLQLYSGNVKGAAKNFRLSLVDPTENAVAQAAWAAQQIPSVQPSEDQLKIDRGFEVRAIVHYRAGEIDEALNCLAQWGVDEPFSSRPFIMGSYIACIATRDFERAVRFCEFGLQSNTGDETLWNNYAVSLALTGRIADARVAFAFATGDLVDNTLPDHIALATEGLLLFREGYADAGRAKYLESIELAPAPYKALIALHLVQEESFADSGEVDQAWHLVDSLSPSTGRPEVARLAQLIREDPDKNGDD